MEIYGYVNGKPVGTRDEFVYAARHRGPIKTDDELLAFAEKVTSNWLDAGWHRTFETYYLSTYALDEPYASLTKSEFERLCEMQKKAIARVKAEDEARCWKKVATYRYADNSVEEVWRDKDGIEKRVTVVWPHGD